MRSSDPAAAVPHDRPCQPRDGEENPERRREGAEEEESESESEGGLQGREKVPRKMMGGPES